MRVLDSIFASHGVTGTSGSQIELAAALSEYSTVRKADLAAILDLAMNN